jgi:hypothetical protein
VVSVCEVSAPAPEWVLEPEAAGPEVGPFFVQVHKFVTDVKDYVRLSHSQRSHYAELGLIAHADSRSVSLYFSVPMSLIVWLSVYRIRWTSRSRRTVVRIASSPTSRQKSGQARLPRKARTTTRTPTWDTLSSARLPRRLAWCCGRSTSSSSKSSSIVSDSTPNHSRSQLHEPFCICQCK